MNREEEIVNAAKEQETCCEFGDIVQSSKSRGVNSAYGIGFLEGAKWADANPKKVYQDAKSAYTSNKDVIEYADKYSHQIWEKLMDNYRRISNYSIGCNDVSDIVLNAIIDACNWLERQKKGESTTHELKIGGFPCN